MMKVLVLTKYDDQAPSSRVRFLQYFQYLQEHDVEIICKPLLDNHYIQLRYAGRSVSIGYLICRYWQRFKVLIQHKKYDVIWLEAELYPYLPAFFENIFYKLYNVPVAVNYDDAVFHYYDLNPNRIKKRLLKNKIAQVMKNAHTVVVGNSYLERYAIQAGATSITKIPTVVDTKVYQVVEREGEDVIRIGWIGTPGTFICLQLLFPVFEILATQTKIKLYTMGVKAFSIPGVDIENVPWSLSAEVPFLQSIDIGVMPLHDTPFERGKCGYKLIQYMACGKPIVGTPLEINREIIENGVNGFWANTTEEWLEALLNLCQDNKLRKSMGIAGRKKTELQYSLDATAPKLLCILKNAAKS